MTQSTTETRNEIVSSDVKLDQLGTKLEKIRKIILIGSGKGGVGKSFVACGLALKLASAGHRIGLFDIDIHGASVPNYLRIAPPVKSTKDGLQPKEVDGGLKVMSVAFLTGDNPVPMRGGPQKQEMITQFFSLTNWGDLDFLIVDLPPSTGDELLSAFSIFGHKSSLILVSTPSINALHIVKRLRSLAKSENVPVIGVILNMAFSRFGGRVDYPFGKSDTSTIERSLDSRVLATIPLEPSINTGDLREIVLSDQNEISGAFQKLTKSVTG